MRFLRSSPAPDPAHIEIAHGAERFRVALKRRPGARRFTLRVSSATGDIVLTLPERADLRTALRFADAHGGWIAARIARLPARVPFAPGAEVPLRGNTHRIVHRPGPRGRTIAGLDAAGRAVIAVTGEEALVPKRVREFMTAEARRDLAEAVARHASALGVAPKRLVVRDTVSRWGSCSVRGHLNFSWRLVLAPPFVLDYLAAHEVAHLREMNHSPRFWAHVRRLYPRLDEAEAWLKRHGAGLHRYG